MSASMYYKPESTFTFQEGNPPEILFTIRADGTIERGPAFTTTDEMSLKFWEAVENTRRPLPPLKDSRSASELADVLTVMERRDRNATIERCAQAVEVMGGTNGGMIYRKAAAAAIRALKDKPDAK